MEFIIKHYHEVEVRGKTHNTKETEGEVIINED